MITPFQKKVYDAVRKIPRGRVATYKAIAHIIRKPNSARAVGNALNKNHFKDVPCHRVILSNQRVGGFMRGAREKILLLKNEGVIIKNNKVLCHCIL